MSVKNYVRHMIQFSLSGAVVFIVLPLGTTHQMACFFRVFARLFPKMLKRLPLVLYRNSVTFVSRSSITIHTLLLRIVAFDSKIMCGLLAHEKQPRMLKCSQNSCTYGPGTRIPSIFLIAGKRFCHNRHLMTIRLNFQCSRQSDYSCSQINPNGQLHRWVLLQCQPDPITAT